MTMTGVYDCLGVSDGCSNRAEPYGRCRGYCRQCFDEQEAEAACFELTEAGQEYIDNPPRGGNAPWIRAPLQVAA